MQLKKKTGERVNALATTFRHSNSVQVENGHSHRKRTPQICNKFTNCIHIIYQYAHLYDYKSNEFISLYYVRVSWWFFSFCFCFIELHECSIDSIYFMHIQYFLNNNNNLIIKPNTNNKNEMNEREKEKQ